MCQMYTFKNLTAMETSEYSVNLLPWQNYQKRKSTDGQTEPISLDGMCLEEAYLPKILEVWHTDL